MDAHRKLGKLRQSRKAQLGRFLAWLERIDPNAHRRIKGLRLITAYGIAAMLGTMADITHGVPDSPSLSTLAGGFALWASVSEGARDAVAIQPGSGAAGRCRRAWRGELRLARPGAIPSRPRRTGTHTDHGRLFCGLSAPFRHHRHRHRLADLYRASCLLWGRSCGLVICP